MFDYVIITSLICIINHYYEYVSIYSYLSVFFRYADINIMKQKNTAGGPQKTIPQSHRGRPSWKGPPLRAIEVAPRDVEGEPMASRHFK